MKALSLARPTQIYSGEKDPGLPPVTHHQPVKVDMSPPVVSNTTRAPAPQTHLAEQYGGNSTRGWVGELPVSWVPYIQLARLSPPVGVCLIYFPHLFGVLLGAVIQQAPISLLWRGVWVNLVGSFFVSNAIHIWNDLVDAPLDAMVERTKFRPLPRGAISPANAFIFTVTQTICAALVLPLLNDRISLREIVGYAMPSIACHFYYPFAKRHTNLPQVVLGFCLAYGVVMGCLTMDVKLFNFDSQSWKLESLNPAVSSLYVACILWTVIYDTIYAHQDLQDDLKAGIKSMAVLLRDNSKVLLTNALIAMTALQVACGRAANLGMAFYLLAVGGSAASLGIMLVFVDIQSSKNCWWWFGKGFWFVGLALSGGLAIEYMQLPSIW